MAFANGPSIVTSGLTFAADAVDVNSYISASTAWNSLVPSALSASITYYNGPSLFTYVDSNPIAIRMVQPSASSTNFLSLPFNLTENFSLEVWYKTTTTGSGIAAQQESPGIIQIGGYNQISSISLWDWSAGIPQNHTIRSYVNNGSTWSHTAGSNLYTDANWVGKYHQIVLNFSGSLGKWNKYDLYIDTQYIYTINFTTPFPSSSIGGGNVIYAPGSNGGLANNSYAIIRYYNKFLSPTEIAQNYNALKSRFGL